MEPERKKRRKDPSNVPSISEAALSNDDIFLTEIMAAKRWMNSAPRCLLFVNENDGYHKILDEIRRKRSVIDENTLGVPLILLRELVSFAANCCFYSTACQFEILKDPVVSVISGMLNSDIPGLEEVKAPAARLISNFCTRKETASLVAQSSEIIPALTDLLSTPSSQGNEQLGKFTLRALRLFADQGKNFRRTLLRNQTAYVLGVFSDAIAKDSNLLKEADRILEKLIEENASVAGKQLAHTEFAQRLVEQGFDALISQPMNYQLIEKSSEVRNTLTSAGIIELLATEAASIDDSGTEGDDFLNGKKSEILKVIICFSRDASGRSKIRSSGLFVIFIQALQHCPLGSTILPSVLEALLNFVYDARSLEHLLFQHPFLDAVINHFEQWIQTAPPHSCPESSKQLTRRTESVEEKEEFRPDSPSYLRIEKETALLTKTSDLSLVPTKALILLRPPLMAPPSPDRLPPPSPPNAGCWSPSASSIGSYASIDSPRTSDFGGSPSSFEDLWDSLNNSGISDPRTESESKSQETDENVEKRTLKQELFLLAWYSHSEQYLPKLCNPQLIRVLINYIAHSEDPNPRCGRILLRLARSRSVLEMGLKTRLHTIAYDELCPGPKNSRVKVCPAAEFREKVMESMRTQAESSFGVGLLSHWLLSPTEKDQRILAAISIVYLIRRGSRRKRLQRDTDFVGVLLEALGEEEDPTTIAKSLVLLYAGEDNAPQPKNKNAASSSCQYVAPSNSCDVVCFESNSTEPGRENESILVSRDLIVKASSYYESMFGGKFAESETSKFVIKDDDYSFPALVTFIHYLYGCFDSPCLQPQSSTHLIGLLHLASKHCRTDLFDRISASGKHFLEDEANFRDILLLSLMVGSKSLTTTALHRLLRGKSHEALLELHEFTRDRGRDKEMRSHLHSLLSACA